MRTRWSELPTVRPAEWAAGPGPAAQTGPAADERPVALPYVVAWNLTRRCNLACAHCYIAAGPWHEAGDELTTAEFRRIADEILALVRGPVFVLSGGEPLLRDDLEELAAHASARGATVVVGTNGTRLTAARIASLRAAGVRGVALSIDSLDPRYHDRFRHGDGALADTLAAVDRLREARLDFVVQTTVTRANRAEIPRLAAWAAEQGAVAFNVYFLVATGRGAAMHGLAPEENDAVLRELVALERAYRGRMLVRSKCQPQLMRHAHEADPDSPLLHYETRCPCGVQYCRITPDGQLTPCPYLPVVAGDLRREPFDRVWHASPVLRRLREEEPGGKCGRCEYRILCGGCRARAYAETGELLGPDPACAYEPDGTRPPLARQRPVTYGRPATPTLEWTPEARRRLERIPAFVRGVVTARIEAFARAHGHTAVTPEVMDEVRRTMPVDFSRRLPFFAQE